MLTSEATETIYVLTPPQLCTRKRTSGQSMCDCCDSVCDSPVPAMIEVQRHEGLGHHPFQGPPGQVHKCHAPMEYVDMDMWHQFHLKSVVEKS